MSSPPVFDMIDRLLAALPLAPELVGAALGVPVVRMPAGDTPAVQAYAQAPDAQGSAFKSIDLRMPDADLGGDTVFLSVTMAGDGGVDFRAIVERYGGDFTFETPSPRNAAAQVPAYVKYEKPWGGLVFGVSTDPARRLLRFIVTTRPPAN